MVELVQKICRVCGNKRKFLKGSERDKQSVCGNCWNWEIEEMEIPTVNAVAKPL
jgi:hypothetical protein